MTTATPAIEQAKPQASMEVTSRSTQRSQATCTVMLPKPKELMQTPDVLPKLRYVLKEARKTHPSYKIDFGFVFRDEERHPEGPGGTAPSRFTPFDWATTGNAIGILLRSRFVQEGRDGGLYFHGYGGKDTQVLGNNAILKVLGGDVGPLAAMSVHVTSDSEYVSEGDVRGVATSIANRIFGMFTDEKQVRQFEDRRERSKIFVEACSGLGLSGSALAASFLIHDLAAVAGSAAVGIGLATDGLRRLLRSLRKPDRSDATGEGKM